MKRMLAFIQMIIINSNNKSNKLRKRLAASNNTVIDNKTIKIKFCF